jgi:hypothetical protein
MNYLLMMVLFSGCQTVRDVPTAAPEAVSHSLAPTTPQPVPQTVETAPPSEDTPEPDGQTPLPDAPPPASLGPGAACWEGAQCESGICEGPGCLEDSPGVCAPAHRPCTRDLRPYCGCDGETFFTSSTCPRQRFEAKGACPGEALKSLGSPD